MKIRATFRGSYCYDVEQHGEWIASFAAPTDAEDFAARGSYLGDYVCTGCGEDLREVGCCCDSGTFEDGSHDSGVCRACCPVHTCGRRDGDTP